MNHAKAALTLEQRRENLHQLRSTYHQSCTVCSLSHEHGLQAEFSVCDDGAVETTNVYGEESEGYEGILHGGVIASLLDGAMTNCLFSYGKVGVTGSLNTRYLHSVMSGAPLSIRAHLVKSRHPLYVLTAVLHQQGLLMAEAEGRFMFMEDSAHPRKSR